MSEKNQLLAGDSPKRVQKTPNLPLSYTNLAATSVQVGQNWANKYPNYRIQYFSLSDFQTEALTFSQAVASNKANKASKKQNTVALAQVVERLKTAASALRHYLKAEFASSRDLSGYYAAYGFIKKANSRSYTVPTDNDGRQAFIQTVVQQLSQARNPIAQFSNGLNEWLQIQQQFTDAWNGSRNQKSAISDSASTARQLDEQLRLKLKTLQTCIKLDFPNDTASVLRSFGFLKETF